MKKADKEIIYNLLKKTDAYVNGFTSEGFALPVEFTDDGEIGDVALREPQGPHAEMPQGPQEDIPQAPQDTPGSLSLSKGPQEDTGSLRLSKGPQEDSSSLTLTDLNTKILRCTKCPLARTRNNVVPGEGVENPDVLVIGEGPGYDEDMSGRPFVGKAGILLDKMLAAINLDRKKNCYIANVVKCRPPNNRDPEPSEQSACEGFLQAQIHILKPKMILCMGRIAGHKMLDTQAPLGQLRGQFHDYNGIPLMVTYHPSALLRDESLKAPAWQDLKAFRSKLNEIKANGLS